MSDNFTQLKPTATKLYEDFCPTLWDLNQDTLLFGRPGQMGKRRWQITLQEKRYKYLKHGNYSHHNIFGGVS